MFYNTKDTIRKIMDAWGGLPEESSWIEYKSACEFTPEFKERILCEVTAFLNSLSYFGKDKFILFGIYEDKRAKKKELTGLKEYCFPDDNEWQNLFHKIKPIHPTVETGTYDYQGQLFGYIYIPADNYDGPYRCSKKGSSTEIDWIRRGGNKCPGMTDEERSKLTQLIKEALEKGITFQKTKESLVMATIGQYDSQNENDQKLIKESTGEPFEVFQRHCLIQDSSMVQRENSIYGITRSPVNVIEKKHDRLRQFSPDDVTAVLKIIKCVLERGDTWYSDDLLDGIMDTLAFLSGSGFSNFTQEIIRSTITINTFQNSRYQSRIGYLAEADPDFMLTLIQDNMAEFFCWPGHKNPAVVQALKTIAWYPGHYEQAVQLLWALREKDTLYGLLHWTSISTAASFQQKLHMVRKIAGWDRKLIFDLLNRILYFNPNVPTVYSVDTHIPSIYQRFLKETHSDDISKLQTYYGELLDACDDNAEDILNLLPSWLQPFPFSNLYWLADHIEKIEPKITDPDDRERLWNRLCNTPLVFITNQAIEGELKERLLALGQLFKPTDPQAEYRQWFRETIDQDLCIGACDFDAVYKRVESDQKTAILTLYNQGGIGQVISFLDTVPIKPYSLAKLLTSLGFTLTEEDDKHLLAAYFDAPEKYADYFCIKCRTIGLQWLKDIGIETLEVEKKAAFFAILEPDDEILQYLVEQMGSDVGLYWSLAEPRMLTACLQTVFEQFLNYGLPEKAFELFRYPVQLDKLPPQWLSQRLISLNQYPGVCMPGDVFAKVYRNLAGRVDNSALEELEKQSFKRYGDRLFACGLQELRPYATFRRIVNDPENFLECVKDTDELLSFAEKLLSQCDAVPDHLQDWLAEIDALCASESESVRKKAEIWTGHILYNMLKETKDGGYTLDAFAASALEQSEQKREGFLRHAYYFSRGFHPNGNFTADAGDRDCAKRFKAFAETQEANGNVKFAECLRSYAKHLIMTVESIQ